MSILNIDHAIRYLGPDATGFEEDAYERGYKAGSEDAMRMEQFIRSAIDELEVGNIEDAIKTLKEAL